MPRFARPIDLQEPLLCRSRARSQDVPRPLELLSPYRKEDDREGLGSGWRSLIG
jgi:hypothetical protein